MKGRNTDLLSGAVWKSIFCFAVPLLIGNLFQQLYNTVDSYVVGNYVGKSALAAVGASSPIINMLIGLFMGMASGAGVVIANYFGAEDDIKLKKTVHTSAGLTLVMGVILTIVGLLFTNPILHAVGIPMDIFDEAALYLAIYFAGIIFALIYNMGSGILRAIGDSKRPLYFLAVASMVNVVLDFIFVKYFHWGIVGAGIATLISQGVSAVLICYVLIKTEEPYGIKYKEIRFDKPILKRIIRIGLPTGFQSSVVSLSNVIVQSYVNAFGSSVVAGYSAAIRIDGFINLPLQSFSMAVTTFVGQNMGAKQYDRVKKGANSTMLMTLTVIGILSIVLYFFGTGFIQIFNKDTEVVNAGRTMQLAFIPFYIFLPIVQIIAGVLRGAGKSTIPMYIMVVNFVMLRQLYLMIATSLSDDLYVVFMGWPVTWIICAIMFVVYYYKVKWIPKEVEV